MQHCLSVLGCWFFWAVWPLFTAPQVTGQTLSFVVVCWVENEESRWAMFRD